MIGRLLLLQVCLYLKVLSLFPDDFTAGYLESEILNQVDILQNGYKFPFWIKSQALVHIRVVSSSSNNGCEFIRLGRNSAIVVNPPGQSAPVSIPRTIIDSV